MGFGALEKITTKRPGKAPECKSDSEATEQSVSLNTQGGLGVARKRKPHGGDQPNRYDISAFGFLAGNFEEGKCNPTLKPKFGTTLAEQDEVSGIDNKPGYVSVFDSEFVAPEPNVKKS